MTPQGHFKTLEVLVIQLTMALSNPTIPLTYSRLIAQVLALHERDLPQLLRQTHLLAEQFLQDDLLITAEQQIQIVKNALWLTKDEEFGLLLGKKLTPLSHGAMGFLANSSPNFLTALKGFQTYSPTRNNFTRVEVEIKEDWLICYHRIEQQVGKDVERCLSEAAAMSFFECAKFIIGKDIKEANSYFTHCEPEYVHRYRDYLPGEYHFNSNETFVKIPLHLCLIPNTSANHEYYQLALRQCETMLDQLEPETDSYSYKIKKMMLSHPPGQLTETEAASELFISKRTLARRLISEGSSFRQLREEILAKQADKYLIEEQLSVEAIATLLNYHDSSNFRRAFKRWYGLSPDLYRKKFK